MRIYKHSPSFLRIGDAIRPSKIALVECGDEWRLHYLTGRKGLMEELEGSVEEVEQVGSTAVPIAARPVPDMLVILIDPGMMWACLDRLGALGHERSGEEPFVMIEHSKPPCQLAILYREHPGRREMLLLRDPLRSDPRLRCRYEALRLDLLQRYPFDRSVQRMVKREFTRSAIRGVEGAE